MDPDMPGVLKSTSKHASSCICCCCGGDAHGLGALPSQSSVGHAYPAAQWISSIIRLKGTGALAQSAIRQIFSPVRPKGNDASVDAGAPQLRRVCTRTRQSIAFRNHALLRATTSFHALQHFGMLFQSNRGSAETYACSEPVHAIDVFVSHNWSTERRDKFLALALYFNLNMAFLAAAIGAIATALLTALEVLPTFAATHPTIENARASIACRITGLTAFFVTLLLGHELKGRLGCKGLRLFVDKAVIHQTDVELKQEGIQHLAAFLAKSDRMVIVYTAETYLKKLWTVYELASMLVLKPMHSIVIIPTSVPKLVLLVLTILSFNSAVHTLSRNKCLRRLLGLGVSGFNENIAMICTNALTLLLFFPLAIVQQRRGRLHRQELRNSVEHFSIQSTLCACENDRAVLYGNIAAFMQDVDLVRPGVSEADALEAFNGFVRSQLTVVLGPYVGCKALDYKYAVAMSMPHLLCAADVLGTSFLNGGARCTCVWMLLYITIGLAVLPAMFNVLHWASCEANWVRSVLKFLIGVCGAWVLVAVLFFTLAIWSETSDGALLAYLGMAATWFMVAAFLYHQVAPVDSPPALIPNSDGG